MIYFQIYKDYKKFFKIKYKKHEDIIILKT